MIIPGILETDFEEVKNKVKLVEDVSEIIQIDINDGTLFDGKTFLDIGLLEDLVTPSSFELHLMVKNPAEYVSRRFKNINRILPHVEAEGLDEFIGKMKILDYSVGLSIDANTDIEMLNPYLDIIDYVQFMTINTGKSGQPFRNDVLQRIEAFQACLRRQGQSLIKKCLSI